MKNEVLSKTGFTLVEVMIVVTIIGLLAIMGIPALLDAMENSEAQMMKKNIATVEKAKAMLQLPSTVHELGRGLTNGTPYGSVNFDETILFKCMNWVEKEENLQVGNNKLVVGAIGTPASYQ